jgi:hypothetical protein
LYLEGVIVPFSTTINSVRASKLIPLNTIIGCLWKEAVSALFEAQKFDSEVNSPFVLQSNGNADPQTLPAQYSLVNYSPVVGCLGAEPPNS